MSELIRPPGVPAKTLSADDAIAELGRLLRDFNPTAGDRIQNSKTIQRVKELRKLLSKRGGTSP